jgi:hypothetical protein
MNLTKETYFSSNIYFVEKQNWVNDYVKYTDFRNTILYCHFQKNYTFFKEKVCFYLLFWAPY